MRGQVIVVKEFNGTPVVARIWSADDSVVFIHSEEEWKKRMNGEDHLDPVGFPVEDAFLYDAAAKKEMSRGLVCWGNLTPMGVTVAK